jgi:hypothetical protein
MNYPGYDIPLHPRINRTIADRDIGSIARHHNQGDESHPFQPNIPGNCGVQD